MSQHKSYIVGNWKMNGYQADISKLQAIADGSGSDAGVEVAICPPATLIAAFAQRAGGVRIGAQDCHAKSSGAHTGCLSAAMLKEAGATFSIVGHSERRADQGEGDADVAAKAQALHEAGLGAIVCVGETLEQRDSGDAIAMVTAQLAASLPGAASADWLSVAYEPVWAIGTGRVPRSEDIAAMHAALRATLTDRLGAAGAGVRILYGGSVNPGNAAEILAIPDVGGALVGGASLKSETFLPIIQAAPR
ncbi:triose-phosphate isomerase [Blastomonas aquatica]|uniref:Triosephosphate isomerase n=1 Tax=Blastomonas aquatica TaxID=1510276 RepID=A0ABQ1J6E5_9SPHN|nr:triose-phosphate isomerase [Blastomonas aquatica]GGB60755.1 triosephosphate isomerase [Blastomonas aquatica]